MLLYMKKDVKNVNLVALQSAKNKINMKTYVIGDIHGSLKALIQVLERSPVKKGDRLIFIGDYVDGWSESSELIEYLLSIENTYECIFLKGNHDEWCKNFLFTGQQPLIWTQQGGQATLNSYRKTGYFLEDSHKHFFKKLHNYYIDEDNRAFVHGGYTSPKGLGHESYQSDYYWDRNLWQMYALPSKNSKDLPKLLRPHEEIFIGHTATTNWNTTKPMNACNVWNIDTGAGWEGVLTIMDVESKEYWQSDYSKDLYPNDKGR